jgi:MATE family multidrug resistance protein
MTPFRRELAPMLRIALPLALAEVGWMAMGLVDTIMVGHLPHAAVPLSAAALAQVLYNTLAFGIGGLLLGLDTTIAQAHGADDFPAANRWLWQGLLLAAGISALLMGLYWLAPLGLRHLPAERAIFESAIPTLQALSWGTLPLMLYFALRRYLQAFNHVRIVAATLISANLVNLLFDWLLIFGHDFRILGMHLSWSAMGVVGSGIATSLARCYQALFAVAALVILNRKNDYGLLSHGFLGSLKPHWQSLRRLLALGLPSGATIFVEISIFAVVTSLIATFGPVALAGHEIALNCISTTFMIPLGISAAASVRVGQAIGRGSPTKAKTAGWAAIAIGGVAMLCASLAFLAIPTAIASVFTADTPVIAAAVPLLGIASLFQFCDGLQITAIGALRGAGDTHSALITHLCSYWILGLPLGVYLGFHRHLGARGLWLGLSASLIVTGMVLIQRWHTLQLVAKGSNLQQTPLETVP